MSRHRTSATPASPPDGATTEKQRKRRGEVLHAVREMLISEGYSGLTMRAVASRCGVSTKMLYEVYGNKDALVGAAVAERLGLIYEDIERRNQAQGLRHLQTLGHGVAEAVLRYPDWARAYATSVLPERRRFATDPHLDRQLHRALQEMAAAGDLAAWVSVPRLQSLLRRQFISLVLQWNLDTISNEDLHRAFALAIAQTLGGASVGEARAELLAVERGELSRCPEDTENTQDQGGAEGLEG